jgi:hypothetical protein
VSRDGPGDPLNFVTTAELLTAELLAGELLAAELLAGMLGAPRGIQRSFRSAHLGT